MLLASWFLMSFFKRFSSFFAENLESVGQRAAKLPAIKLWERFDCAGHRTQADWFGWGQGRLADFFLRPPTLKASNFAALQSTDPIFTDIKDLNCLKKHSKNQEASSIFRINFAISKWPHFHSVYLLRGRFVLLFRPVGRSEKQGGRLLKLWKTGGAKPWNLPWKPRFLGHNG